MNLIQTLVAAAGDEDLADKSKDVSFSFTVTATLVVIVIAFFALAMLVRVNWRQKRSNAIIQAVLFGLLLMGCGAFIWNAVVEPRFF